MIPVVVFVPLILLVVGVTLASVLFIYIILPAVNSDYMFALPAFANNAEEVSIPSLVELRLPTNSLDINDRDAETISIPNK